MHIRRSLNIQNSHYQQPHQHTLQYRTLKCRLLKAGYCICSCAQKWFLAMEAIDFLTSSVWHLLFPASTACNMRLQVFFYPKQSILLSQTPQHGWSQPKYLSPPTHSPVCRHHLKKAFSVIKNMSESEPNQSNNSQTSRYDYRALTVSLICASESARKAKKSKKSLIFNSLMR